MVSYWDIRYVGSHTNVFIKKFQRTLSVKPIEIERERFVADAKKYERSTFFVEHKSSEWAALSIEVLELSNRLAWKWTVLMDLLGDDKSLYGELRSELDDEPLFQDRLPNGFYSLHWEIRSDQAYERKRLSKAPDAW